MINGKKNDQPVKYEKWKTGVIISLLLICCYYAIFSQNTDSLAHCKTLEDTLQYVLRELADHKSEYTGKPGQFYELDRNIPDKESGTVRTLKYVNDFIVKDIDAYISDLRKKK